MIKDDKIDNDEFDVIVRSNRRRKVDLQDGISELIEAYKMIVPQESSHYRNSFPLSYGDAT